MHLTSRIFWFLLLMSMFQLSTSPETKAQDSYKIVPIADTAAADPNEISVTIDPSNPNRVMAVSMQRAFESGKPGITNYGYVSNDGGLNWETKPHPNPGYRIHGDDAIVFGNEDWVHHSYIAFKSLREERPIDANNGIFLTSYNYIHDQWGDPVPVIDHINTNEPFEDKPWLTVDRNPNSPYQGRVYVSWTRFDAYGSYDKQDSTQIYISHSVESDNGRPTNFAKPIRISDVGGNAVDSSNTVEGAVPMVGLDSTLYVVWTGPQGIVMDRSLDGGQTFQDDSKIADHVGGWDVPVAHLGRANAFPIPGMDRSKGANRGRIYVNWIDRRDGELNVYLAWSDDKGKSWSDPKLVNQDINDGTQFFTWMAVDPEDGSINIAYLDRSGLDGSKTRVTLARSVDGGQSFTHYKLEETVFKTNSNLFFGDYIGLDAVNGRVVIGYTHFKSQKSLGLSAAVFQYEPGTQNLITP